jgi:hypothetical protein
MALWVASSVGVPGSELGIGASLRNDCEDNHPKRAEM